MKFDSITNTNTIQADSRLHDSYSSKQWSRPLEPETLAEAPLRERYSRVPPPQATHLSERVLRFKTYAGELATARTWLEEAVENHFTSEGLSAPQVDELRHLLTQVCRKIASIERELTRPDRII